MADRISSFPDAVLCHILSFLPTKESVATTVLSKRWKPLWRSVPTLHFEEGFVQRMETHSRFVQSVYAFILCRYLDQPLQRFHLQCTSSLCDPVNFHAWINAALQQRLEHFHLCLTRQTNLVLPPYSVVFPASLLPSSLFNCKTLVVLKLIDTMNKNIFSFDLSSVDLPSLKALHLQGFILERRDLAELLRGSYNLQDLVMRHVFFFESEVEPKFERLSKLVRATIGVDNVPFEVVSNVEVLRIESMRVKDVIPEFQNLTHLELSYLEYNEDWAGLFEMLKHCPKLQSLAIDEENMEMIERGDEGAGWPYLQSVPLCISLHLKTCSLRSYGGSKGELRFARYIMQNARHLDTMAIYTVNANRQEKLKMLKKLSLCTRGSTVCKLSFK